MKNFKEIKFEEKDNFKDFIVKCKGCDCSECDKSNAECCPAFIEKFKNDIKIFVKI